MKLDNSINKLDKLRHVIPEGIQVLNCDYELDENIISVVIPKSVISIDDEFFRCNGIYEIINYSSIEIEDDTAIIKKEDKTSLFEYNDFIFIEKDNKYYLIKYIGTESEIKLPSNVINNGINIEQYEIARRAFNKNNNLKKVIIPSSVNKINEFAFYDCENLEYVEIEASEYIGRRAFVSCNDNIKIILPNNLKRISADITDTSLTTSYCGAKYIGSNNNPYLLLVKQEENITECRIHPKCKIIQGEAFADSKLEYIYIPKNIIYIANCAFADSKLKKVLIESYDTIIAARAFIRCDELEK